jgi:hypothetical protein
MDIASCSLQMPLLQQELRFRLRFAVVMTEGYGKRGKHQPRKFQVMTPKGVRHIVKFHNHSLTCEDSFNTSLTCEN